MTVAHQAAHPTTVRSDSVFFSGMALAMAAVVFTGFAPSWFLRSYIPAPMAMPPLSPLIIMHGTAFTLWMVLFIAQASLVAANRRDIHRKLGWCGLALAVAMLMLGYLAAVNSLRQGITPLPAIPPASFFAVPIISLVAFAPTVLLGILNRSRPNHHKRYMLLAAMGLLIPAAARIPLWYFPALSPLVFGYATADAFLAALLAYDYFRLGKIHPATWIGAAILVASEPGRILIGQTAWWQAFAHSLI